MKQPQRNNSNKVNNRENNRLLDYYRARVENTDRERLEMLERLEALKLTQEEQHRLEWENKRRFDDIQEMQEIQAQTLNLLNKERKQGLIYQFELENKEIRSLADRSRLRDLLLLAEPIEQTVKLYHDKRPSKMEKFSNVISSCNEKEISNDKSSMKSTNFKPSLTSHISNKSNVLSEGQNSINHISRTNSIRLKPKGSSIPRPKLQLNKSTNKLEFRISPSDEKQQIVRTIVFPNDEENLQDQEIEMLKRQLYQLKAFYEDQAQKQEDARRLRDEEIRLQLINASKKIEELMKRNHKLEKLNHDLTKDYMHLKFESSQNERQMNEELELIRLQNESLASNLKEMTNRNNIEKDFSKNDHEKKLREVSASLRNQVNYIKLDSDSRRSQ